MPKKKKKSRDDFYDRWEYAEVEARRRSAWGHYVHTMSGIRRELEARQYYRGDAATRKRIDEKRKNETDLIYIG